MAKVKNINFFTKEFINILCKDNLKGVNLNEL